MTRLLRPRLIKEGAVLLLLLVGAQSNAGFVVEGGSLSGGCSLAVRAALLTTR